MYEFLDRRKCDFYFFMVRGIGNYLERKIGVREKERGNGEKRENK